MPSIAELSIDKIADSYRLGEPITQKDAILASGGSLSYAESSKLKKTKTYLARLPELNAIATARKIKLEALADKYAKIKAKDAKFSELAQASAIYRKDVQTLTGGNSGDTQPVIVNIIKFSDTSSDHVAQPVNGTIPKQVSRDSGE